jgi:hypothetical protein
VVCTWREPRPANPERGGSLGLRQTFRRTCRWTFATAKPAKNKQKQALTI